MTENLLLKYWMIWGPAQTFNFMVVPQHLRVVFVALVSFFWVYLLSMISSQGTGNGKDERHDQTAAVEQEQDVFWRIPELHLDDLHDLLPDGWNGHVPRFKPQSNAFNVKSW
jgi:hypothetical protein